MADEKPLLVVCGSRRKPSRTREVTRLATEIGERMGHAVDTLDFREYPMELFYGRTTGEYDDVTNEAVTTFLGADRYLIASPIYFGGISGALKNLIDHIPYERFETVSRSAGMIATGRDDRHRLVVDSQLRATLVYLGVDVATTSVFVTESEFDEYRLDSQSVAPYVESVISETVALQENTP